MTDTPAPEAPAAPITEDSAHAGHDRPVPTGGRDSTDEGRKLVIASAYGAPDADEWVADARRMGVTVMRLTDIVETGLEDCLSDPEGKYEEMDLKARTAADAGMGVVLDLSFIRNAAIRAGRNPYKEDFDWSTYVAPLLARPFPTGGTYGTSEHIVYVSLPGEPHVDWGDDPNEKADTAEDLIAFYQRLARVVRRAGVDRPVAAGGFIHHTADGNGTDAGLDITAVYSLIEIDVCTTHAYDQDSLNALPMLTRYAHALGKPFILEETGRNAEGHSDAGRADWFARVRKACADAGVGAIDLFGVPVARDEVGSRAWAADGILNRGIAAVREEVGDALVVCADTCLDEFTSHGHCGLVRPEGAGGADSGRSDPRAGEVDNDSTLALYQAMAVSQAEAGAHMVSPSGMMDGQVAAIRAALDATGHDDVAILAYSAKYASAYFGPFREAVGSTLTGDRRTYQQDPANRREGLREAMLDVEQGADMVMVKPAGPYLDVLADVAAASPVPVAAYQVSGEYAMVEAAAANGWIDRDRVMRESVLGIVRAGADCVLTYWARELAEELGR